MNSARMRGMALALLSVACAATGWASGRDLIFWPENMIINGQPYYPEDPYHPLVGMRVSFDITQENGTYYAWFAFRNVSTDPTARIHKIGFDDKDWRYLVDDTEEIICTPPDQVSFKTDKGAIGGYKFGISTKATQGAVNECLGPNGGESPQTDDLVVIRFQLTQLGESTFSPGADVVDWLNAFPSTDRCRFAFQAINVDALGGDSITAHDGPGNSFITPEFSPAWLVLLSCLLLAALGVSRRDRVS